MNHISGCDRASEILLTLPPLPLISIPHYNDNLACIEIDRWIDHEDLKVELWYIAQQLAQ